MTLVRRAMILCVIGLLAASAAMAGVPSASTSTVPNGIDLVGTKSGIADNFGAKTFTIRDASNNPVPGSVVILNFSACSDLKLCSTQPAAGVTVNCAAKTITGVTNASGQVTFTIVGFALNAAGNQPGAGAGCVGVTADGVPLPSRTGSAFDQNGSGGVGAADLSAWIGDFVAGTLKGRSDYNKDSAIGAADLSIWIGVFVGGNSSVSCSSGC